MSSSSGRASSRASSKRKKAERRPWAISASAFPGLRVLGDAEQDQPDREHRDDHDDREEQHEATAKAREEQPQAISDAHVPRTTQGYLKFARFGTSPSSIIRRVFVGACAPRRARAATRVHRYHPPHGAIAQLEERLDRTQEVAGSSPASSISRSARSCRGFVVRGRRGAGSAARRGVPLVPVSARSRARSRKAETPPSGASTLVLDRRHLYGGADVRGSLATGAYRAGVGSDPSDRTAAL